MPQKLSITGPKDAVWFSAYSNWKLSADQANSARRELPHFKGPESGMSHIVGKADTESIIPSDPKNPQNSNLSIILLRHSSGVNAGEGKAAVGTKVATPQKPKAAIGVLPSLNQIKH